MDLLKLLKTFFLKIQKLTNQYYQEEQKYEKGRVHRVMSEKNTHEEQKPRNREEIGIKLRTHVLEKKTTRN